MPKGKKFTAAEKHFEKKRVGYEREIQNARNTISTLHNKTYKLNNELVELQTENAQLEEWIERLLEYTELSREDIKQACEQDKIKGQPVSDFIGLVKAVTGYTGFR